jgi:hypothetical protein
MSIVRWSRSDLPYLMEHLIHYHGNAVLPPEYMKASRLPYCRYYLQQHKIITTMMGDLHQDVFSVIKQNGYSFDDITRTPADGRRE